uniref:peptidylprolyl isomerase n=1 Tax=Gouania willdenowi TaxID=441366 RepID=A0A8C5DI68_GOUWI
MLGDGVMKRVGYYIQQPNNLTYPLFWFTLGNKEVIPALDVAVRLMGMGEKALIQTDERYAYGLSGNLYPEIPSGADLSLEVKLLEAIDAPDLKLLSPTEKIALATCKKEQGNVLYRCRAYKYLMEVQVKCFNNMAASMLKLEQYDVALQCCYAVLIYQPENVKALFHTGKVLASQDKYSEAIQTLQKALELEPHNKTHEAAQQAMDEKMLENPSSTHKHQAMDEKMLEDPSSTQKHQAMDEKMLEDPSSTHKHQAMDEKMLEDPSSTHKHQAMDKKITKNPELIEQSLPLERKNRVKAQSCR